MKKANDIIGLHGWLVIWDYENNLLISYGEITMMPWGPPP